MNANSPQQTYVLLMQQYCSQLTEMEATQSRIIRALAAGNLEELQRATAEQQAEMMNLSNMEARRMQVQRELGYADMTFRQIIEVWGGPDKELLNRCYGDIDKLLAQIKFLTSKASEYINSKLETDARPSESYGYTAEKKQNSEAPPAFLQTKI